MDVHSAARGPSAVVPYRVCGSFTTFGQAEHLSLESQALPADSKASCEKGASGLKVESWEGDGSIDCKGECQLLALMDYAVALGASLHRNSPAAHLSGRAIMNSSPFVLGTIVQSQLQGSTELTAIVEHIQFNPTDGIVILYPTGGRHPTVSVRFRHRISIVRVVLPPPLSPLPLSPSLVSQSSVPFLRSVEIGKERSTSPVR